MAQEFTKINGKTELLKRIKDEILDNKNLPLYKERTRNKVFPVIGEGSHDAKIMFIGEAPGKNEAEQGRPFCGASGRILDELLASAGIDRKEVYITNIVKDRPPQNRDPLPQEIEAYAPYLDRQVEIIQPEAIATLGRFSMVYIVNKFGLGSQSRRKGVGTPTEASGLQSISRMHGKMLEAEVSYGKLKIVPLYHPAVAVYNANMKDELKKDFKILQKFK